MASNTPPPQCQVLLSLAHLLQQHSLSYDAEKDTLLNTSVITAISISNTYRGGLHSPSNAPEGEVHLVLTGSPRPTFAETNAWLLDSPTKAPRTPSRGSSNVNERSESNVSNVSSTPGSSMRGSYSILDNNVTSMDVDRENNAINDVEVPDMPSLGIESVMNHNDDNENDDVDMSTEENDSAQLLQEYIAECTHNSTTTNANMSELGGSPTRIGESVLLRYRERRDSEANNESSQSRSSDVGSNVAVRGSTVGSVTSENNTTNTDTISNKSFSKQSSTGSEGGPMVGQAVVNAINKQKGVGLQSSRAKLLQGTIDRPLWDQRRWTDGECLFSELIDKCGLECFVNSCGGGMGNSGSNGGIGADAAAGGWVPPSGEGLAKQSNMSSHLITVPATKFDGLGDNGKEVVSPGLEDGTIDEIARGILRNLKRKKSPPCCKIHIVLPPVVDDEKNQGRKEVAETRLKAAFQKLEQYNDMIGAPKLMSNVEFEFVDVVV